MKFKFLFFDVDNTILDFDKAEDEALTAAFSYFNIPCNRTILDEYKKINISLWEKLEKCQITRDEVLFNRFALTFEKFGFVVESDIQHRVSDMYTEKLHDCYSKIDYSEYVLDKLKNDGYKLYVVSNGILSIQKSRMRGSGLNIFFDKTFVSEEIGFNKPSKKFFDLAFAQIENFENNKSIIIGDSLTSDIQGGINAGISTCWFNPKHKKNSSEVLPDYEIDDLRKLFDIL